MESCNKTQDMNRPLLEYLSSYKFKHCSTGNLDCTGDIKNYITSSEGDNALYFCQAQLKLQLQLQLELRLALIPISPATPTHPATEKVFEHHLDCV